MARPFHPTVLKAWEYKLKEQSTEGDILRTHVLEGARLTNDHWNIPPPQWLTRDFQIHAIVSLQNTATEAEFLALLEYAVAQYIGIDVRLTYQDTNNIIRASGPIDYPLYRKFRAFNHGQLTADLVIADNDDTIEIPNFGDDTDLLYFICPPPARLETLDLPPPSMHLVTQPGPGRAPLRRVIHAPEQGKTRAWPILYLMIILGTTYPTASLALIQERQNCIFQTYDYNIINPIQVRATRLLDAKPFDNAITTYENLEYNLHKECDIVDNIPEMLRTEGPATADINLAVKTCRAINESLPVAYNQFALDNIEYYIKATAKTSIISGWATINNTLMDLNDNTEAPETINKQFCDNTLTTTFQAYPSPQWIWLYQIKNHKLCLSPAKASTTHPAIACNLHQYATRYAQLCLQRSQLIAERIQETKLIRDLIRGKAIAMRKPDYKMPGQLQPRVLQVTQPRVPIPPGKPDPDAEIFDERPRKPARPRYPKDTHPEKLAASTRPKRAAWLVLGGIGIGAAMATNEIYQHVKIAEAHNRINYLNASIQSLDTIQNLIIDDIVRINEAVIAMDQQIRTLNKEVDYLITDQLIMQNVQQVTTKVTTYSQKLTQILDVCASTSDIGSLALDELDLTTIKAEAQQMTNEDIDTTKGTCMLTYTNKGFLVEFAFPIMQRERKALLTHSTCMPNYDDHYQYNPDQREHYFAFSLNSNTYTPLTSLEFAACLTGICKASAPTHDESIPMCGGTNFYNRTDPCDYKITDISTPFFYTHGNTTIYKTNKNLTIDVHCQHGGPGHEMSINIKGFGSISTPDFCYLQIDDKLIFPETFIDVQLNMTTTNMTYPFVRHQHRLQQLNFYPPSPFTQPAITTLIRENATSLVPDFTMILVLICLCLALYLVYKKVRRQKKWVKTTILGTPLIEHHPALSTATVYKEALDEPMDQS